MKERIYLNLGNIELLAVVVRNGLFNGSWIRMKNEIAQGEMVLPGISLETLSTLQSFEKKHALNLNRIIFTDMKIFSNPKYFVLRRQHNYTIQRICYAICRGLFTYPCVAVENRLDKLFPGMSLHRTYLARPLFNHPEKFNSLIYQGVNRMKPIPEQFPNPSENPHDSLLEQLNKIRECNPCTDQSSCADHKFVTEATGVVIKEFHLENSFVGKLLARSLCWMTAEESRLMRLLEKEGLMITPQTVFPPDSMDAIEDDFFTPSEVEGYYSENPDVSSLPAEPHPLLDVIHDLRESIRDTIRLLTQIKGKD